MAYKNKEQRAAYRHWYRHECASSTRVWWREYKKTLKCERCGETHTACLDFHHEGVDIKEGGLSRLAKDKGKAAVLVELEKCIVLCANCHRKHHWMVTQTEIQQRKDELPERTGRLGASERMKHLWATDPAFRERHRQRIIAYNESKRSGVSSVDPTG